MGGLKSQDMKDEGMDNEMDEEANEVMDVMLNRRIC